MQASRFIRGDPYPRKKVRGNVQAANEWSAEIKRQTERLPKVKRACRLEAEFVLPKDRFPLDHPFGTDLDNLLERLLDALKETVLSEAPGGDGAVVELRATKVRARLRQRTGVKITITDEPWTWATTAGIQ